jgi:hypothetical protein
MADTIMNNKDILRILQHILNGVDPVTRTVIVKDSVWGHYEVREALREILRKLKKEVGERANPRSPRAGEPWSSNEDIVLRRAYESGLDVDKLVKRHLRTSGAIRSRLVKLGLLTETTGSEPYLLVEDIRRWATVDQDDRDDDFVKPPPDKMNRLKAIIFDGEKSETVEESHWFEYHLGLKCEGDQFYWLKALFLEDVRPANAKEQGIVDVLRERRKPRNLEESLALALILGYRDNEYGVIPLAKWLNKYAAYEEYARAVEENQKNDPRNNEEWLDDLRNNFRPDESLVQTTDWEDSLDDSDSAYWEDYLGGSDDHGLEN